MNGIQAWQKFVRCEMEKISVFCVKTDIYIYKGFKRKGIESFVKRVRIEMMGKYICRWVKHRSMYMQAVKKIHEWKFESCWSEQICYYICKVSKSVKTLWPSSIDNYFFLNILFCVWIIYTRRLLKDSAVLPTHEHISLA